jgi:hypothetical protein
MLSCPSLSPGIHFPLFVTPMKPHFSHTDFALLENISISKPHTGHFFVVIFKSRKLSEPGYVPLVIMPPYVFPKFLLKLKTCHGNILPEFCRAFFAACSIPPQQGTTILMTITDL